jgi:hypothetical protein
MALLDDLLQIALIGTIHQVVIGIHWTAVVAEVEGEKRCGLASTLMADHDHHSKPDVQQAGIGLPDQIQSSHTKKHWGSDNKCLITSSHALYARTER